MFTATEMLLLMTIALVTIDELDPYLLSESNSFDVTDEPDSFSIHDPEIYIPLAFAAAGVIAIIVAIIIAFRKSCPSCIPCVFC